MFDLSKNPIRTADGIYLLDAKTPEAIASGVILV